VAFWATRGWPATPFGLGVVRPPQGKTLKFFCFPFCLWGGQTTHMGHGAGSATPKTKPSNFFASRFALEGGQTTPMGHGGGLATLKTKPSNFLASRFALEGAKSPPWATGVVWPPPCGPKGVAQSPQKLFFF
jgi:hypothetical protein